MTRLFVPAQQLGSDHATLDAAAHRHLVKVLRLEVGAELKIFDGTGMEIEARVEAIGKATVEVALGSRRKVAAPACTITLLQAPPRGDRMDLIVQKTTELGVARVVPVLSERTMVKPSSHQRRRWQTIAEEAARQCGRADVPEIRDFVALRPALTQPLGEDVERFVLWEGAQDPALPAALAGGPREVALLVGPEGGLASQEVSAAHAAGFVSVGLGPRILRAETAAIVAVALAQAAAGGLAFGQ
jgi:16S rRNA (uracil1498-N3)-methyltransferase